MFKKICLILLLPIIFISLTSCNSNTLTLDEVSNTYSTDNFIADMTSKGYDLELRDSENGFLPTVTKVVTIADEQLAIYQYVSNDYMEKDASNIDSSGCAYFNGEHSVEVSWISYPHFYKKVISLFNMWVKTKLYSQI